MNLILIIIPIILMLASQAYIDNTYKKYQKVYTKSEITGAKAARMILDKYGLEKVKIEKINGSLTDNFNPKTNTISLSQDIYEESTIASVAVAAHECGHVIQHKEKYFFIVLRSMLVPVVNLASKLGYIVLIIGCIMTMLNLAYIGLALMCGALIFQLITLPTEFDASRRAKKELIKLGIIDKKELPKVKEMLKSAAFTYVASFFSTMLQMLRMFLSINRRN